jgi:hypothetical protein
MWVVSADRDNILVTWWERGMTKPEAKKEVTRNLLSAGQDNLSSNS